MVAILNPYVTSEAVIQRATQLVADLGETERLQTSCNTRMLEGTEVTKTRRPTPRTPQLRAIRASQRQMFNDSIQAGVQLVKIYRQPNHVLLQLWRQLKENQKFQSHPKETTLG